MRKLLKKVGEHIARLTNSQASAGFYNVVLWEVLSVAAILHLPHCAYWHVRPRQVKYPLHTRLRGSSDLDLFDQIFIAEEYRCLMNLSAPTLVLDLGANIGFSAAYFLNAFPEARVVAVEPDPRNVAVCKANLLSYGDRALILEGAVWDKPTTLRLKMGTFRDGREWASQVGELVEGQEAVRVDAWDVASLIDMCGGSKVDLLKVDIEGAELHVFGESAGSWLHRVRNICIELHGKDCEDAFFKALQGFDYELGTSGELTICRNLRAKTSAQQVAMGNSAVP